MKLLRIWLPMAVSGVFPLLHAQTSIDLRTQAKSVDFSSAAFTKPSKVGTALPATCSVGETFFNSSAPSGQNLYGCTATNSWSLLGGNLWFGGGTVSTGDCAKFDSSGNVVSAGGACGPASAVTLANPFASAGSLFVSGGAGRQGVASMCTDNGGTLSCPGGFSGRMTWLGGSGTNSRQIAGPAGSFSNNFTYMWADSIPTAATLMKIGAPAAGVSSLGPAIPDIDYVTPSGSGTLQNKSFDSTNLFGGYLPWVQISTPTAPAAGFLRIYAKTGAGLCWVNSSGAETCAGSGTMSDPGGTGMVVETSPGATANRTITSGSPNVSVTNGSGASGNPTIDIGSTVDFSGKTTSPVQVGTAAGIPVTCSVGQLYFASDGVTGRKLQTCTAANTWTPAGYDQGAVTPGTCSVGQIFFNTSASAGQNLYFCATTNAWTQMRGAITTVFGRTGAVTAQAGDYSYAQISNTPAALPPNGAASGDLSGSYPSPTVAQVNGTAIPAGGVLKANSSRQIVPAVSGTDYAPATSGAAILKANGSGGFLSAAGGSDYEFPLAFSGSLNREGNSITCGAASGAAAGCLSSADWTTFNNKQNSLTNPVTGTGVAGSLAKFTAGGTIGNATAGTDYAPATAGTFLLKGNGGGGFGAALAGADFAPATGTTSVLKGNGSGGFSSASAADIVTLFAGCSGTQYLGADGTCHAASAGSGYVALTTGGGAPSSNCAAPSATNLATYLDTTNGDEWWCYATNSWKKVLSVTGSGPYGVTGATGTAPSAPASGFVTCYFDSTKNNQICFDTSGNAYTMVKDGVDVNANAGTVTNGSHITNSSIPNSGLMNPAPIVNGQTCTLGSACTVTAAPSGSAAGDLGSTYPNPTVAQINGAAVPASAAVAGTNSSKQLVAATAANVASLFSGCSGTQYLGADGACHTASGGSSSWPAGLVYYGGNSGGGLPAGNFTMTPSVATVYCVDAYDRDTLTPSAIVAYTGVTGAFYQAIVVLDASGNVLLSTNLSVAGGAAWQKFPVSATTLSPGYHSWCTAIAGGTAPSWAAWPGQYAGYGNQWNPGAGGGGVSGAPVNWYTCPNATSGSGSSFTIPQYGNCPSGHGTRAAQSAATIEPPVLMVYQ